MFSRLCRLSLWVMCVAGLGSTTQASPWMYDPYTPYYAGYAPYYSGYSGYSGVYAASYSPGLGCSGCQTSCSSCSPCSCSPCIGGCSTGCASGNCASGNCSTTTNSTPSGTLSPVPDPNSNSRSFESRLEAIERHLNLRSPAPAKPRTYDDQFKSRNSTGTGNGTNTTEDPAFPPFKKGGTTADDPNAPFEENVNKPVLTAPAPGPAPDATGTSAGATESVIQTRKPAAGSVDENSNKKSDQGLRLDTRVTSRAVSPRERQTIIIGGANAAIATAKKPATLKVDARSINVAKY